MCYRNLCWRNLKRCSCLFSERRRHLEVRSRALTFAFHSRLKDDSRLMHELACWNWNFCSSYPREWDSVRGEESRDRKAATTTHPHDSLSPTACPAHKDAHRGYFFQRLPCQKLTEWMDSYSAQNVGWKKKRKKAISFSVHLLWTISARIKQTRISRGRFYSWPLTLKHLALASKWPFWFNYFISLLASAKSCKEKEQNLTVLAFTRCTCFSWTQ